MERVITVSTATGEPELRLDSMWRHNSVRRTAAQCHCTDRVGRWKRHLSTAIAPRTGVRLHVGAKRQVGSEGLSRLKASRGVTRLASWEPLKRALSTDCAAALLDIEELYIYAAPIGDAVLKSLGSFPRLRTLYLVRPGVSDATLEGVDDFGTVRHLVLEASARARICDTLRRAFRRVRNRGCVHFCWR